MTSRKKSMSKIENEYSSDDSSSYDNEPKHSTSKINKKSRNQTQTETIIQKRAVRHHRHHHGRSGSAGPVSHEHVETHTVVTNKTSVHKEKYRAMKSEVKKWRETSKLLIGLVDKTLVRVHNEPSDDEERRSLLVDGVGDLCRAVANPMESKEYKELLHLYEKQQRKYQKLQKRTQKMLAEVEENREQLDAHMKKIREGERTATDKVLKNINSMMATQLEYHRALIEDQTLLNSAKSARISKSSHISVVSARPNSTVRIHTVASPKSSTVKSQVTSLSISSSDSDSDSDLSD